MCILGDAKKKKKKKNASDDEAFEESDDGDEEGRECDYISDSSDSESELEQQKEIKSVAEEDALRKLLASDEDEDDEEQTDKKGGDEDKDEDDENKEKEEKVTKKKCKITVILITAQKYLYKTFPFFIHFRIKINLLKMLTRRKIKRKRRNSLRKRILRRLPQEKIHLVISLVILVRNPIQSKRKIIKNQIAHIVQDPRRLHLLLRECLIP